MNTYMLRYAIVFVSFIFIVTLTIYFLSAKYDTPKPILEFDLTTHRGEQFISANLPKKPTLVFFGFTQCPTICPTTLQKLTKALNSTDKTRHPNILFVTVNTSNDTPDIMKNYLESFHSSIVGLTGKETQLIPIYETFKVYLAKIDIGRDNHTTLNHSGWVYFFDENNNFIKHVENTLTSSDFANEIRVAFQ